MGNSHEILGVYSQNIKSHIGTGTTAKRTVNTTYHYVTRVGIHYHTQPLNEQDVPSGMVNIVAEKDFIKQYSPEVYYYQRKTLPALKTLHAKIEKGEEAFEEGKLDEAEHAFAEALLLDPDNPKANLGMGTVQCSKENFEKLAEVIKVLLNLDTVFLEEQRHEFNIFGIALRKNKRYKEAISFYSKALEIHQDDENLHFNIARAYFETNNKEDALIHIEKALEINPEQEATILFKKYLLKKKKKKKAKPKPAVPEHEK
ncbi:M48 family metallopeptidase [Desulfovibrio sp. JC010]|uniref:tetratricopeptide repeat protein n=1 Tax=Desulfovibrio sp. JC010 TaxID=2593641 RepID=UPI0013D3E698|nr:tetratricopeptide repeat protein [Desulfovibrio sp. JC010]NDV25721.1 tetratricopeptide repeat protein [Desulfovibrio sp. JC010]